MNSNVYETGKKKLDPLGLRELETPLFFTLPISAWCYLAFLL